MGATSNVGPPWAFVHVAFVCKAAVLYAYWPDLCSVSLRFMARRVYKHSSGKSRFLISSFCAIKADDGDRAPAAPAPALTPARQQKSYILSWWFLSRQSSELYCDLLKGTCLDLLCLCAIMLVVGSRTSTSSGIDAVG